jgi:hypothetical protein
MFETITYEHACGTEFIVLKNASAFADFLPDELKNEPPTMPEQITGNTAPVREYFVKIAQANGSKLVDPKDTPLVVCICGKWIDFEQLVIEYQMKQRK